MYVVRGLGGVLYVTGALIMCYNLWMTVRAAPKKQAAADNVVAAE
jgi:cytochrome c oxidase cbb3-type subunit 1